jgi:hypothetical protein
MSAEVKGVIVDIELALRKRLDTQLGSNLEWEVELRSSPLLSDSAASEFNREPRGVLGELIKPWACKPYSVYRRE